MKPPENAWQIKARRLHDKHGGNYEEWRRVVAIDCLLEGETRPIQEILYHGEQLGAELSRILAIAMDPEHFGPSSDLIPYELKLVHREGKKGRPRDLELVIFRGEVADRVKDWMATGSSLEGAIATVIEEFGYLDLNEHTIRKWYRDKHGRKARQQKGKKPTD